jgi:hypothetical protein
MVIRVLQGCRSRAERKYSYGGPLFLLSYALTLLEELVIYRCAGGSVMM